ncbi:hypothetical protein B0H66DRAFT_318813 [Apodospora peruviana]|uniref:Rhodopsin domain-containing protein n=1 Tax=Apodospora peruviana TaxID=516989 RepID=A0AAE0HXH9_9PEZI|nr:hypothetical protein B0H66DRAFT_318813 [Apodospora peruviana]
MVVTVLFVVFESLGVYVVQLAFGVDIWTVRASDLALSLKLLYVAETLYLSILTLTKISILCFYLRIFPHRTFRAALYGVMAWVAVSGLAWLLAQILQCVPINFIWEGWKQGSFGPHHCIDVNTLGYTMAGFSIAQDIVILVMPLPLVARLNVSRRSKLEIMIMFSLGFFVFVTSCVRLWALHGFGDSVNPTWDYTDTIIWTGLEVAVSIIVTSLPAIRVLFRRRPNRSGAADGRLRLPIGGKSSPTPKLTTNRLHGHGSRRLLRQLSFDSISGRKCHAIMQLENISDIMRTGRSADSCLARQTPVKPGEILIAIRPPRTGKKGQGELRDGIMAK